MSFKGSTHTKSPDITYAKPGASPLLDILPMESPTQRQIGSKDRSVGWYDPKITTLDEPIRTLLQEYSKIPPDEVIPRIVAVVIPSILPSLSI